MSTANEVVRGETGTLWPKHFSADRIRSASLECGKSKQMERRRTSEWTHQALDTSGEGKTG